jgi:HD-GYP domain-containing protein (c-di-GMP phosphodiesterase class II)
MVKHKKPVAEAIKQQIKILNGIVLLVIYIVLLMIVRFLYVFLEYISTPSLIAILSIMAGLMIMGLYVANSAARHAIKTIDNYRTKLCTLLGTTRDIREIVYGDVLLENILESSLKITEANAGSLLLAEGDKLVFKVVKGSESSKLIGFAIPMSYGIAGWVVSNNISIRIDDAGKDSRFYAEVDKITGYETKSVLCVPLKLNIGTIGALELINKKAGAFSADDEELIAYFADQAAIAIARAKFYEDQKNYEIHLTGILLDTMENHIHEKKGHSKRVAKYSLLLSRAINMSEDEKKKLYRACLLHDIGFLKINLENVSSKEEYKAHSQLAYDMLQPINFYADVALFVLYHHERYDGKGYPSGLKGEDIPIESRIISIAEAFDAMVSRDSYRYVGKLIGEGTDAYSYSFQKALEELKNNAGTQFDPELVEIFVRNISESSIEDTYLEEM